MKLACSNVFTINMARSGSIVSFRYSKPICVGVLTLILVLYSIHGGEIVPRRGRKYGVPDLMAYHRTSTQNKTLSSESRNDRDVRGPSYRHISDDRKIILISVPFTDNGILESSSLFDDKRKAGHPVQEHNGMSDTDRGSLRDYSRFAVARHPCSRLVDTWNFFVQGVGDARDELWVEKNMDAESLVSFDAFVETVLFPGGPVHVEKNRHLRAQVGMIFDEERKIGLDQLLVFERWNESIALLANILTKSNLSDLSIEPPAQKSCRKMYSPRAWEKLIRIYAMDFCVLGYSMEIDEVSSVPEPSPETSSMARRFSDCSSKFRRRNDQVVPSGVHQSPRGIDKAKASCSIYTYYNEVKTKYKSSEKLAVDQKTISTWKKWWTAAGWDPRVLSEEDAKSHPQYHELREKFLALPTTNAKGYEMACFMRHVAMAAVGGGWMSDFDVLPFNIPACLEPLHGGNFTVYQRHIPALVSGRGSEYTRLANRFANVDYKLKPEIYFARNRSHVSDMHILGDIHREGAYHSLSAVVGVDEIFSGNNVCETHSELRDTSGGLPKTSALAIHYSHESVIRFRKRRDNGSIWPGGSWTITRMSNPTDLMRAEFMEDSMEYVSKLCHLWGTS